MRKSNIHLSDSELLESLTNSHLVRIIITNAMYDTMWRMLGFRDLNEMPNKEEEGIAGRRYNKGFLYAPGSLLPWDADSNQIQFQKFDSSPVTIDEFTGVIHEALTMDLATLVKSGHYALSREIDNRTLRVISSHLAFGSRSSTVEEESRVAELLKTLNPRYVTKHGGRTKRFAALSVCLSYLSEYMEELRAHYPLFYNEGINDASNPIIGAAGKLLAPSAILAWRGTRYREQYGGLLSIGGYGRRDFCTFSLESKTAQLREELKSDNIDKDYLFGRYVGKTATRDMVLVLRRYNANRWGSAPTLKLTQLINPSDLGLEPKDLRNLADASFDQYKKILEKERRQMP